MGWRLMPPLVMLYQMQALFLQQAKEEALFEFLGALEGGDTRE